MPKYQHHILKHDKFVMFLKERAPFCIRNLIPSTKRRRTCMERCIDVEEGRKVVCNDQV